MIGQTLRDPFALRDFELSDPKNVRERHLYGVIGRPRASRLAPGGPHDEAAGLHRAPAIHARRGRLGLLARRIVAGWQVRVAVASGVAGNVDRWRIVTGIFAESTVGDCIASSVRRAPVGRRWRRGGVAMSGEGRDEPHRGPVDSRRIQLRSKEHVIHRPSA